MGYARKILRKELEAKKAAASSGKKLRAKKKRGSTAKKTRAKKKRGNTSGSTPLRYEVHMQYLSVPIESGALGHKIGFL